MLSKLYNAVFETENSNFDINKNFFTVLFNFTSADFCGGQLATNMNRYLPKNSFEECNLELSERTKSDFIAYLEGRNNDSREYNVSTCFTFLFDYNDTDLCKYITDCISVLYEAKFATHNDKVVVMIALPDNMEQTKGYIKSIENADIPENVTLFFFIKAKFSGSQLVDDISGTLLLNSDKQYAIEATHNEAATKQTIATAIQGLYDTGKAMLAQRKKTTWASVTVTYNDDKMDFLRYYMHKLYDNVAQFSKVDMNEVCSKFNESHLINDRTAPAVINALHQKLMHAIEVTPKVNTVNTDESMSLITYFNSAYGRDGNGGDKIVELTLKVNLRNHNIFNNQMVADAAEHIYSIATQYHSNNIQAEIISALDRYLESLKNTGRASRERVYDFAQKQHSVKDALPEFVKKYITYDDNLKQYDFWRKVREYILHNQSIFGEKDKICSAMSNDFSKNRNRLNYFKEMGITDNYPSFPAKVLLQPESNKTFCMSLREAYNKHLSNVSDNSAKIPRNAKSFDPFFEVNPSFRCDYNYVFTVGNTFSVMINHRIGQYFMFGD